MQSSGIVKHSKEQKCGDLQTKTEPGQVARSGSKAPTEPFSSCLALPSGVLAEMFHWGFSSWQAKLQGDQLVHMRFMEELGEGRFGKVYKVISVWPGAG